MSQSNLPSGVYAPASPKVMILGEAYGRQEHLLQQPFVGTSGKELKSLLKFAGFDWASECYITNLFLEQPTNNDLGEFCVKKVEAQKQYRSERERLQADWPDFDWPQGYTFPAVKSGQYVRPDKLDALARLKREIEILRPNLIIACGATPAWAVLGVAKIKTIRGAVAESTLCPGVKVLPVFHPAAILRQWSWRPILIADLMKARDESHFPEIRRKQRTLWLEPTLEDLSDFDLRMASAVRLSIDIETARNQITCIGFATSDSECIVVPFVDKRQPDYSYWRDSESEAIALAWVRKWLQSSLPKVLQNGTYDLQWLWWQWGIPVWNYADDTMLKHHAYQPEMEKSLGFMGSVYTNEASWKLMRKQSKEEGQKRDD